MDWDQNFDAQDLYSLRRLSLHYCNHSMFFFIWGVF
jgi:hypothetical protein